ncbi:MAG: hypothetical protein AB7O21_06430 [Gammaproteobacteria bacterium]
MLIELRTNALVRGDCDAALEYSQALLARGEALQDRLYLLHGHTAMAVNRFYSGEYPEALRHIEEVARRYELQVDRQTAAQVGFDPLVMSWFYGGIIGWTQGDFVAESSGARRAEEVAASIGHPHVTGMVLLGRAVLAGFHGDTVTCAAEAAKLKDLSAEQQFPDWLGCAEAYLGWASAMQGDPAGVRQCRDAVAHLGVRRFYINHPLLLSLLVECALVHGETGIAGDALAEAERVTTRGGVHYWDAERERLHGELLAATAGGDPEKLAQAATHFERALSMAQSQGALSFALRAARGMAHMLDAQGRHVEARDQVRAVASRFSATADSPELSAARSYVEKSGTDHDFRDFRENRGLSPISAISPPSRASTSPTD